MHTCSLVSNISIRSLKKKKKKKKSHLYALICKLKKQGIFKIAMSAALHLHSYTAQLLVIHNNK